MEQTRIQLNESAYVQAKRISALLAVAFAILCCVLLFTFVLTGFLVADSGMEPALMKGESL